LFKAGINGAEGKEIQWNKGTKSFQAFSMTKAVDRKPGVATSFFTLRVFTPAFTQLSVLTQKALVPSNFLSKNS
jgi:hypothetical protein